MHHMHHWPLLAVLGTAILGVFLLLWILFHLFLEARTRDRPDRRFKPLGTRSRR